MCGCCCLAEYRRATNAEAPRWLTSDRLGWWLVSDRAPDRQMPDTDQTGKLDLTHRRVLGASGIGASALCSEQDQFANDHIVADDLAHTIGLRLPGNPRIHPSVIPVTQLHDERTV
jgi:hypothetical protein